jgi:hypothetical protein
MARSSAYLPRTTNGAMWTRNVRPECASHPFPRRYANARQSALPDSAAKASTTPRGPGSAGHGAGASHSFYLEELSTEAEADRFAGQIEPSRNACPPCGADERSHLATAPNAAFKTAVARHIRGMGSG